MKNQSANGREDCSDGGAISSNSHEIRLGDKDGFQQHAGKVMSRNCKGASCTTQIQYVSEDIACSFSIEIYQGRANFAS